MIAFPPVIRRHKWKFIIGGVVVLLVGFGISGFMKPKAPEYITAVARKGDLRQTVEAVGTVISEQDLQLQFRSPGIVDRVFVREGDRVQAGQNLASIRAGSLAASVGSAAARAQEMQASLDLMRQGTRPEDIAIAEAGLANKKAQLQVARESQKNAEANVKKSEDKLATLKLQVDVNVSGNVQNVGSTVSQKLIVAQQALNSIDDIFRNNDVVDAVQHGSSGDLSSLQQQENSAKNTLAAIPTATPVSYDSALNLLQATRIAVAQSADVLTRAYDLVSSLQTNSFFTNTAQTAYKTTLATQRSGVQAALRDLDAAATDLKNLPANLQTQIAGEESNLQSLKGMRDKAAADLQTYETSIKIDEAQLQLKRAGSRPEDIRGAEARWRQAQADLARASSDYADTFIRAPVSGIVTKMNVKQGEATPTGPAVTMVGDAPYRIEMFVSEVDVPKVTLAQSGSIELDAFHGTHFQLHVSEIDTASTNKDGVSKYRVKLDFIHPHNELKIGMTGDAQIISGMRTGVVHVPRRAVLDKDPSSSPGAGGKIVRILGMDNKVEERPVTTGMEGESGEVEVSGIQEGETVIVLTK